MRIHSQGSHKADLINILFQADYAVNGRVCIGVGAIEEIDRLLAQADVGKAHGADAAEAAETSVCAATPQAGQAFDAKSSGRKIAILCQPTIAPTYAEPVLSKLRSAGYNCRLIELPDGEACKSHEQLLRVWSALQEMQMQRSDCIIGIGGGALTDLAGFAAATYLRGIKLVLIPTTLLAQVDAAIGGKTGINLPSGKNLAGTFYFPEAVIVDTGVLSTLPPREFRSGLGEIIKYALIEDTVAAQTEYRRGPRSLLSLLQDALGIQAGALPGNAPLLQLDLDVHKQTHAQTHAKVDAQTDAQIDPDLLLGIINACIRMKVAVVAKDPREGSLRRCLNLGHTLGHAVEKVSQFKYTHGEAVAIGCVFACRLAERLGKLTSEQTQELVDLLERAKLPVQVPADLSKEELLQAMAFDKKSQGGAITWVVPDGRLAAVDIDVSMPVQAVRDLL